MIFPIGLPSHLGELVRSLWEGMKVTEPELQLACKILEVTCALIIAEDIISELTMRYADRVGAAIPVGILMEGLENITFGRALLYYVHGGVMVRQRALYVAGMEARMPRH